MYQSFKKSFGSGSVFTELLDPDPGFECGCGSRRTKRLYFDEKTIKKPFESYFFELFS